MEVTLLGPQLFDGLSEYHFDEKYTQGYQGGVDVLGLNGYGLWTPRVREAFDDKDFSEVDDSVLPGKKQVIVRRWVRVPVVGVLVRMECRYSQDDGLPVCTPEPGNARRDCPS